MNKCLVIIYVFLFLSCYAFGTHNRAGEITYRQISELTFEVTIITYTATGPGWTADRPKLDINWGDNTTSTLNRVEEVFLPDYYKRNKYVGVHKYPGPGIYVLVVEDPNRNLGVSNIPNSVNTVFSISTTLMINPQLGSNNTPILTQPPIDKAAVGRKFVHNPGAYDPDGDSLSYKLTVCRAENGQPIAGYTFPEASNTFYVDEVLGDLVWDAPIMAGIYNVAMLIEEWRNNIKIGEIVRDMQIEVYETNNKPPVIISVEQICVEADSLLTFKITATDQDNDRITLSAAGAPFVMSGSVALFEQTLNNPGYAEGIFTWQTSCELVRKQPYNVNFKAEDNSTPISLVDIKSVGITVVAPPVKNLSASANTIEINLSWDIHYCPNITGYNIYRKISPSGFVPEFCQVGVPPELGYTKIRFVQGRSIVEYTDKSVSQGHEYCYLVTAVFADGAESYVSNEVCAILQRGIPTITNVSVLSTDTQTGSIYVAWSKPTEIDIGTAPGPYQYVVYRSEGYFGENLQQVYVTDDINDTIWIDNGINTKDYPYSYKVEFYNNAPSNRYLIGAPHIASSIFVEINQMENALELVINKNTPWINHEYTIYKYNETITVFDSLTTITNLKHIDRGLINGKEYCYYVRSKGEYSIEGIINPIYNLSQINCAEAIDTTPPCPPVIFVESFCDSVFNYVTWQYHDTCNNDVKSYKLFYTPFLDGAAELITVFPANVFKYKHFPQFSMAGCYYMTAVDTFNNESVNSNRVCVDNCTFYRLPNVFTPNNDGINDYFRPIEPYYFVTRINIQIFNRWGLLMYETTNPDIIWDGRDFKTGKKVSDGVYFYVCDVYEQRLTGEEVRHLVGFVHVFNGEPKIHLQE
ncbi:MAG TPA: gliding motility-associated C-terminal domain-containing protein [Bacteroidales bacterium]|nr:gliding motility-associated C-terminal domain-containing protein [Bacteroidales bacterium]HOL97418.1 gliding motility-associated C-terminal domain-containing protein [Bacteroidales bacterium]HOM36062.1 gliding motility-associated C-terminal domain-containing protein [Bacteroidales bacterium]HPD23372.1 gliding motility-associated C-terminal domain-containing protein [Bacteroidales bacterium]HRT00641.1 gliding motility-associated C-terminal domain-containing protein [Bacteroidales bacterium]